MGLPMYLTVFGLNSMEKCKFSGMLGMISSANSILNLSTVVSMKWGEFSVSGAEGGLAVEEFERVLIVRDFSLSADWETKARVCPLPFSLTIT